MCYIYIEEISIPTYPAIFLFIYPKYSYEYKSPLGLLPSITPQKIKCSRSVTNDEKGMPVKGE